MVASPTPKRIFELNPIKWLLDKNTIVVCAGGGGIPTAYDKNQKLCGIEAVIDKDFATELLARELQADLFVMATDADGVYIDWGKPSQKLIKTAHPNELKEYEFAAGSMGPKVEAACQFALLTGKDAAIGSLDDLNQIANKLGGTTITTKCEGMTFYD